MIIRGGGGRYLYLAREMYTDTFNYASNKRKQKTGEEHVMCVLIVCNFDQLCVLFISAKLIILL